MINSDLLETHVLRVWLFLDIIVSWHLNLKPLRQDKLTTINLRLQRYRGEPVKLDDGSVVNPKDLLVEIHLNNTWFLRKRTMMNSPGKIGWEFLSAFSEDLNYLAKQVSEGVFGSEIKAIHARTLLRQDQGSQRLGFTVMDLPNTLRRRLSQFYLAGLRQACYPKRARRPIVEARPLVRKEIWMSRRKLLQSYGPSTGGLSL